MKTIKKTLLVILLLLLYSCVNNELTEITDTIPNINLEFQTEEEIVISDLFYSENYNISFSKSDDVDIKYNKESNTIKLKSKSNFVGMTLIKFMLNEIEYSIPVTISKNASYKFQFTPDKSIKSFIYLAVSMVRIEKILL